MTLLQQAVQYHRSGDWQQAEILYRQVLQMQPQESDALHLLGQVRSHFQNYEEAQTLIEQAIQVDQTVADYYNSLGNVLEKQRLWEEAEKSFRQALALDPQFAEAYYNLGKLFTGRGQFSQAETCWQKAITIRPELAQAHYSLGSLFHQQGRFKEAVISYQRAITVQPNFAEAYNNLGNTLKELGANAEAKECFQRALAINPSLAVAHCNLGELCFHQSHCEEAIEYLQQAITLNPNYNMARYHLANVFEYQGQHDDAIACYQKLLEINPLDVVAHDGIGRMLWEKDQHDAALDWYRQAVVKNPQELNLHNNLGVFLLITQGHTLEAQECFQTILALSPNYADAYANLGHVISDQGRLEEAIPYYHRALALQATPGFQQNLLFIFNNSPFYTVEVAFSEHRKFDELFAIPLAGSIQPLLNTCDRTRKLKIGYLSPDFRQHSVAYFLEPILAHHDHQQFEIFCYYSNAVVNQVTRRFQGYADHWRDCARLSDFEFAEHIRRDQIDILVDLAAYTGNRILIFARRPAPVQVTYLGYPNTTGVLAIDYRFTDHYIDVPENEKYTSEIPIKLPASFYCYQPHQDSPPINALPALQTHCVTFGCLNGYGKVNVPLLEMWAKILQALPGSKLVMQNGSLEDVATRQLFETRLTQVGIALDRVIIKSFAPIPDYLKIYHQIDIALDTYPCNGGTTTCEALWMGIPVVTLVGQKQVSHLGLSILSTVGLTDLIATTPEEYVNICIQLAHRLDYLQQLRHTMRQRMQASPLMDAPTFTRHIEEAYQNMWKRWCDTATLHQQFKA